MITSVRTIQFEVISGLILIEGGTRINLIMGSAYFWLLNDFR